MNGNIETVLSDIAVKFGFDADQLIAYSYEDHYGGYHTNSMLAKWTAGSIWEVEGRILYALVRALNPQPTAEIGVWLGCGSTHIAAALKANGSGLHHACDINTRIQVDNRDYATGELIPAALRYLVNLHFVNGLDWLKQNRIDFLFDDGSHDTPAVRATWALAAQQLTPGGMIVSHDAMHFAIGQQVRDGIIQSGVTGWEAYLITPADCGLAMWRKPQEVVEPEHTVSESLDAALLEGRNNAKHIREDWQRFVPPMEDEPEPEITIEGVKNGIDQMAKTVMSWSENVLETVSPALEELGLTVEEIYPSTVNFGTMTRAELREYAKNHGIVDANTRSKHDLLEMLRNVKGNHA